MNIQGLRKHYDSEATICKLFINNKEPLEDIVGMNITNLHLEVLINKKRIDLVGQLEDDSLLLLELLIRVETQNDFAAHIQQIIKVLEIVGKNRFVQIILMSPEFRNEDIVKLQHFISDFNVVIHFVKISRELIFNMKYATTDYNSRFIEYRESYFNKLVTISSKKANRQHLFTFPLDNEEKGNDISKKILQGLRKVLDWHNSIHRYKNLKDSVIRTGSGISDVMFNFYCNKEDKIKIEIDFAKRVNVFNLIKNHMADMSNKISYPLNISNKKYSIYSEIFIDETVVETSIKVAKEYIEYVSEFYKKMTLEKNLNE